MNDIELHVHSFSLRHRLRHRDVTGFDVFAYIESMASEGFTGVNVSANGPGYRDLCGTTAEHFGAVRAAVRAASMRLEIDTSDTRVENMTTMLEVAAACGADTLRTYTKYRLPLAEVVALTIADLRAIAPLAADLGITVVLENHEDFTGPVLRHILGEVDHPSIRALYDYGNSQMVGEDPLDALDAMAPFITRVHGKDHVMLHTPEGDIVQGVPFGTGRLPVAEITDRLYAAGVRRFCFENVWGYVAPLQCPADALPPTPCFVWDRPERYLRSDHLDPADAVAGEASAFQAGLDAFRAMLANGGYRVAAPPAAGAAGPTEAHRPS
jgi:sugar phosphate isomerase/epimerase